MKNLLILLVVLFLFTIPSCNEDAELLKIKDTNNELNIIADNMASQLGLSIDVENIKIINGQCQKSEDL